MARTHAQWKQFAAELNIEGRAFINGAYTSAADGKTFDCINPANGQKLADIAWCGEAEVDAAVKAARAAFESGAWSELAPLARGKILKRFAALIREHGDELALLETLDMGKPIGDSTTVDVPGAAYCVEWFAEAIDKIGGEVAPVDPKLVGLVTREAIGVVAAVVPWNFPILMASWKFGPALAAGNAVIVKPSEKSRSPPSVWPSWPRMPAFRMASSRYCRVQAKWARRWPCTWTWIAWHSPAPPAWAS
jgi:gamma-glutamyl-gamma-aminobutyraldehyde dehydrogenase